MVSSSFHTLSDSCLQKEKMSYEDLSKLGNINSSLHPFLTFLTPNLFWTKNPGL